MMLSPEESKPSAVVEADRKKFAFAKNSPIALLDVDGTLIGTRGADRDSNQSLINALRESGITRVILFTTSGSDGIRDQAVQKATRMHAIELLKEAGIEVMAAVVTFSADFENDQPLGSYYQNEYSLLENETIEHSKEDLEIFQQKTAESKLFKTIQEKETASNRTLHDKRKYQDKEYEGGKEVMLRHVLNRLPNDAHVVVFDDKPEVANVIREVAKEKEVNDRGIHLNVVEVNMKDREKLSAKEDEIENIEKMKNYKNKTEKVQKKIDTLPNIEKEKIVLENEYKQTQEIKKRQYKEIINQHNPFYTIASKIFPENSAKKGKLNKDNLNEKLQDKPFNEKLIVLEEAFRIVRDNAVPDNKYEYKDKGGAFFKKKNPLTDTQIKNIEKLKEAYISAVMQEGSLSNRDLYALVKESKLVNFRNTNNPLSPSIKTGTRDFLEFYLSGRSDPTQKVKEKKVSPEVNQALLKAFGIEQEKNKKESKKEKPAIDTVEKKKKNRKK